MGSVRPQAPSRTLSSRAPDAVDPSVSSAILPPAFAHAVPSASPTLCPANTHSSLDLAQVSFAPGHLPWPHPRSPLAALPRSRHSASPLCGTCFQLWLYIHLWDSFPSVCLLRQHGLSLEPGTEDGKRGRKGSETRRGARSMESGDQRGLKFGGGGEEGRAWGLGSSGGLLGASAPWKELWAVVQHGAHQPLPSSVPSFPTCRMRGGD